MGFSLQCGMQMTLFFLVKSGSSVNPRHVRSEYIVHNEVWRFLTPFQSQAFWKTAAALKPTRYTASYLPPSNMYFSNKTYQTVTVVCLLQK